MWVALEKFNGDAPITKKDDTGGIAVLAHTLDKCIEGVQRSLKSNRDVIVCRPLYEGRADVWVMGINRQTFTRTVVDWYVLLEHEVYG